MSIIAGGTGSPEKTAAKAAANTAATADPSAAAAESRTDAPRSAAAKTFEELFAELGAKAAAGTPGSRTVELVEAGVHAIGKKIVEEAAEVWMAAEHEGADRTAEEISQLLYHLQVLMVERGIGLEEVYSYL